MGAGIDDTKAVGKMQENETSCDCVGCGGWRWLGNRCEHVVEKNKYQLLSMVGSHVGKEW